MSERDGGLSDLKALIARLRESVAETESDPWMHVRAIMLHPDVYEAMKADRIPVLSGVPAALHLSGIEILTSTFALKTRAELLDSDRKLIGVMGLATGTCYFIPPVKMKFGVEPDFPNGVR